MLRPPLPHPFLRRLALRVALLWSAAHAVLFSFGFEPLTPLQILILIATIFLLVRYHMRRHGEWIFLANLGTTQHRIATLIVAECAVLELALGIARA